MCAGTKRWLVVMLWVRNSKHPPVVRLFIALALRLEDHELKETPCRACTRAPSCRFGLIRLGLVTLIIVTCLDIRMVWFCPLDVEAVAMLHPVGFKRVVGFFVGSISVFGWRINAPPSFGFHWKNIWRCTGLNSEGCLDASEGAGNGE
jgi:hypothetical protein